MKAKAKKKSFVLRFIGTRVRGYHTTRTYFRMLIFITYFLDHASGSIQLMFEILFVIFKKDI